MLNMLADALPQSAEHAAYCSSLLLMPAITCQAHQAFPLCEYWTDGQVQNGVSS